jgi:aldehyde dehydrogenase (NAD+)
VVKPAEDTPVTGGLLIAKIYEEAGLPPGLLNIVIGPIQEIGDPFTLHPIPRLISFTGSTKVGRHIGQLPMSGPQMKRVSLELGGNAPCVILDDVEVEYAAHAAVIGRFLHQGQICMSTNRVIVDAKVYDEFIDRFTAHVKSLKYGDPNDPDVSIGPIINKKKLATHMAHIQGAPRPRSAPGVGWRSNRQGPTSACIRECQERDADRSGRIVRPDRPYYQSEWRS